MALMAAAPCGAQSNAAQAKAVAPVIKAGFDAYRGKTREAAVDAWVGGSVLAQDPTVRPSLLQAMGQVENIFGDYDDYDVLKVVPLGAHASRTYVVFLYERGPAFAYFDVYTTRGKDVLTAFQFHTKPHEILPSGWWAQ
jgi:hypothetical protein